MGTLLQETTRQPAAGLKSSYDFNEALGRIQDVTGCYTQQELADLMGVRQSSISDALKRRSVSANWLLILVKTYDLNPDWILYGADPKYLHEFSDKSPRFDLQTVPNSALIIELGRRLNQRLTE